MPFFLGGAVFLCSNMVITNLANSLPQCSHASDKILDTLTFWMIVLIYENITVIIIISFTLYFSNRHRFLKEIKSPSFSSSFTSDQLWFRSPVGSSFSASYCHSCHFWLLISRVKLREKKKFFYLVHTCCLWVMENLWVIFPASGHSRFFLGCSLCPLWCREAQK